MRCALQEVLGVVGPLTMVGEDHADALLSWQLMNMDTACTGHTRHHLEGMECAIDIVEETTCKTGPENSCKDADGNRFPCPMPTTMGRMRYSVEADGTSFPGVGASETIQLNGLTGDSLTLKAAGMLNRAVVIYNSKSERVACALLYDGVCPPGCKPNLENPLRRARTRNLLFSSTPDTPTPDQFFGACGSGCTPA